MIALGTPTKHPARTSARWVSFHLRLLFDVFGAGLRLKHLSGGSTPSHVWGELLGEEIASH